MDDITKKFKKFSIQNLIDDWKELVSPANGLSEHEKNEEIQQICSIQDPKANSIVFSSEESSLDFFKSLKTLPKAVVLPLNIKSEILELIRESKVILLLSPNPKLAMALISQKYFLAPRINGHFQFSAQKIHPSANVHSTVKMGNNVFVGPNVTIGKDSVIGANCKIGSNAVLEEEVSLGANCEIHANTTLGWGTIAGDFCVIQSNSCIGSDGFGFATSRVGEHYAIPHLGRVNLGKHVHIGAGCFIDRGTYGETSIGDFTKIDNIVHIAHNCKIGKSCLITAGFLIAGSSEIGNFFVTGGRTTVTGHVKIADNVQIAGISTVQKSVTKAGKYGGYPIRPLSEYLKTTASLSKILEFRKDLDRIKKLLKLNKD